MNRTVFRGGRVFDGRRIVEADVAVEGDRIMQVASAIAPVAGERVIDIAGALLAPGLIDCHVHTQYDGMDMHRLQQQPFSMQFFSAKPNFEKLLHSGVTTIRDGGGIDLGVKTAVQAGIIAGPRMRIAISVLSQTGGHADGWNVHGDLQRLLVPHPGRPDSVVDGADEMRKRVREIIRAGADVIKICASGGVMSTRDDPKHPQFSYEELAVCVQEAADQGRSVMAHAHGAEGIKRALKAGVRSIEHGIYIDDECLELFAETGAWLVPTLLAPVALVEAIDAGMVVTDEIETKARGVAETHQAAFARAHQAGVRIAMGTDSGVFAHGHSPRELVLMVRAGMSPEQALHAATRSAAELLEVEDEVGSVEVGKIADLIVLDGDWSDFDSFDDNLRLVMQAGVLVRG